MGRLIGQRPDDDGGTIVVASYHVGELSLGILVGVGILPRDGPIDGDFRPQQETLSLSLAHGQFVVRIMGQSQEVTTQLTCPAK